VWAFFSDLLKQEGFVALLFAVVLLSFGLTVRALWNTNQALHRELRELQEKHTKEIAHLQEKRVEMAQVVTREVMDFMTGVESAMDKIAAAVETMKDLVHGRRR